MPDDAGHAEEQLRLLVASVRDYAIFMLDPSGRIASWNAGAQHIKGYAPEEVIGEPFSIFYTPEDRAAGKPGRLLEAALSAGSVEDEGWRVRKDGTRLWANVTITALRDAAGRLRGFGKVTRDLTGRREMEERLRRSEESLAATLYSIGDGVLAADERGRIERLNPVAERLTGWLEKEAIGRPIEEVFRIVNEESRAPAVNPVARVLAEGIVVGLANHTALIARDGTERPIADSGAPIRDAHGATRGAVLVFRDVTDERKAEEALRLSEERYRLLLGSVRDYAIFMLDRSGRIQTWNAGARQIKGYEAGEVIGKHISIFYTAEDLVAGKPQRLLDAAIARGRVEDEGWRVRKDGARFWADVVITPLRDAAGDVAGFAKVTRDLTTRMQAEERLRTSEERLAATLSSIGDGVIATDPDGRVTLVNRVAERLTGWEAREAIGRPIAEVFRIINEVTRAEAPNPVERAIREGIVFGLANHTALVSRAGEERPIADSGAPIRDGGGAIQGAVLVFRDVTEERRAAEALRQSEERLRLLMASVRDYAIFMLDERGRIATWNAGAERIHGYSAHEAIGLDFARLFVPDDAAAGKPLRALETAARLGRLEDEGWRVRKDGSRFWANAILSAARDEKGRLAGFAKITRDLTEQRQAEDQRLRLAQAQEAIRLRDEFLSIASHELKTPLTALKLQLVGVQQKVGAFDEKLASRAQRAVSASDRLADLIEALLDVSRMATGKLTLSLEPCDLVALARDVADRQRESATAAGCAISIDAEGAVTGRWDRLRVEQILTNLLSNATKYAPGTPIAIRVRREEGAAILQVADGGPGIPEADRARIFERFERASPVGYGGLGLGLYIARQIAEAHGGTLTAANVPGDGAIFTVRLPLVAGSAP